MRATVSIAVPAGVRARQLNALAALLDHLGRSDWAYVGASLARLDAAGAAWPDAMAETLERLAVELRRAAEARQAEEEATAEVELELEAEEEAGPGRETVNVTRTRL